MTCKVGIIDKKEKKVYIGGDSAGVAGLDVTIRKDAKVFKVGEFVIGCTSSFRMIQLIRFSFHPPKKHEDEDIFQYMCTGFVNELRKCFREGGFQRRDNEVESGGCFLVGWRDRLFMISNDYQVGESVNGYDSVGCGESYAIGALDAMAVVGKVGKYEYTIEEAIIEALQIAAYRSAGVRPPYIIEST